ncbi:MAG: hypothetical protein E7536_02860 [Ruminococcaceae bacterium]|nr:hypothetical protein [Oscillospiraceae bacterium]
MFTCIELLPENTGFFNKFYEKINPPEPVRQYVQLSGATPFLRLCVRKNYIDWRKISSLLIKDERVILADEAVNMPQSVPLEKYEPASLSLVMIFRTLCKVLEKSDSASQINLSVFDRRGILVPYIEKIVPLVRNASVYTENVGEYFYCVSKIMNESGMSIKINEYDSTMNVSRIIVADSYLPVMKKADFVFLAEDKIISYNTVTGSGLELEKEYKMLKSQGIDDFCFASALFERNNARFFAEKDFTQIYLSQKVTSVDLLASRIRCR